MTELKRKLAEERAALVQEALKARRAWDAAKRAATQAALDKGKAERAMRQREIDAIAAKRFAEHKRLAEANLATWANWRPPIYTARAVNGVPARKWSYNGVPHNRFAPK